MTRADALDMVVMRLLHHANFIFKAQDGLAVFAVQAVHDIGPVEDFLHPVREGIQHQGMVVQIARFDKLHVWELRCDSIGGLVDPFHQNAGK